MSAAAAIEHPCPRHLTTRTTVSSGILVYRNRVPWRSLKRWPQEEQYKRRMRLFLPIHSTTLRQSRSNDATRDKSSKDSCPAV